MCFMASSVVNTASGSQGMINIRADEEAEDDAGQTLTDIEQQEVRNPSVPKDLVVKRAGDLCARICLGL